MNVLREQNKNTMVVSIILLVLFFFISHRLISVQGGFFEQCCSYITYPIIRVYSYAIDPVKKYKENKKTIQELQQQLEHMQQERNQMLANTIALEGTALYNNQTAYLQEFKERYNYSHRPITQILVRHFSDQGHYFLVDAGHKQDITVDMVAVVNNVLIGRVVEVYPWYSKVSLITDRACKVAAISATTQINGVHEGRNNESTALCYISHLSPVKEGELVLSSGQGLIFPQGFGLGRVESVRVEGLYQEVQVKPLLDLKQLNYCVLIAKADLTVSLKEQKEKLKL